MNTTGHLIVALVAAHLLADFVFQSRPMAERKRNPLVLLAHASIAGALAYLLTGAWRVWEIPVVIAVTHGLIDFIKVRLNRKGLWLFTIDQLAHLAVIVLLARWIHIAPFVLHWVARFGDRFSSVLIVISGAIAVTVVSGVVVENVVKSLQTPERGASKPGFPSGGARIGQLERTLVFILFLIGQPGAIGFLVAAKSILRFGELKEERREAEYVIIGTMWSLVCALLVTLATRWALRL
jgi:hypothetical protein